ncbi:MAG: exodeoxyribonuclease VII large subunit, partial [Candidatus Neomarinimicrobiota bacterium]
MDESRIYRVSEITDDIRELVEERWSRVRIRGECSNVTHHRSGHVYFVLKEANHELRCVLFKGYAQWLRFRLEDGLEVIVTGRITVFTQRGQLQCVVTTVEPAGQGTLFLALERLKNRLQAEGLFRNDRKRPLPPLPQRVGVLTSDTGAAIRDILQILE